MHSETNIGKPEIREEKRLLHLGSRPIRSIWEDAEVSKAFAERLEPRLTIGQIQSILQQAQSLSFPNLVILDSALSGCRSEQAVSMVEGEAHLIYDALLLSLTEGAWQDTQTWKAWRTLALIKGRWALSLSKNCSKQQLEQRVLDVGLKLLSSSKEGRSVDELLQISNFVLAYAEIEASLNAGQEAMVMNEATEAVIPTIVTTITSSSDAIRNEISDNDQESKRIYNHSLIAQVLLAPKALV